jgi:hypothetical protein
MNLLSALSLQSVCTARSDKMRGDLWRDKDRCYSWQSINRSTTRTTEITWPAPASTARGFTSPALGFEAHNYAPEAWPFHLVANHKHARVKAFSAETHCVLMKPLPTTRVQPPPSFPEHSLTSRSCCRDRQWLAEVCPCRTLGL